MTSSTRLHTVEIEDFGPLTILGLTKRQMMSCRARSNGDQEKQAAMVFALGMSKDERWRKMSVAEATEFARRDGMLDRLLTAILERSWPEAEF